MANTTGSWQKGHEILLQDYIKSIKVGCEGVATVARSVVEILSGKDSNDHTKAIESMFSSIVGYCNGELNMLREAVGEIVATQAKVEEHIGSSVGYAELVRNELNSVEDIQWSSLDLVVGGEQPTEEDLAALNASFAKVRDAMQDAVNTAKSKFEEMDEVNAMYREGIEAVHKSIVTILTDACEFMKTNRTTFRAMADDASALVSSVGSKSDTAASDSAAKATSSAREMMQGIKPMDL